MFEVFDPLFKSYVLFNAPLELLGAGFRWLEGPVWFGDADCLLFSDIPNNRILRWQAESGITTYRYPANYANGHTRDREGRLLGCSHGRRAIIRTEYDGTETVLAEKFENKSLNSPNDIVVKSDGTIWFSDPHYGINTDYEGGRRPAELPANLYRFDPATGKLSVVADDFAGPNGLCFSPDEKKLYVVETGEHFADNPAQNIRVFNVTTRGDKLGDSRVFHTISPGNADGIRCDEYGNVWSSAADGVHCINPDGKLLGKVLVPRQVANLTFGDRQRSRLFICATDSLFSIFLNVRGAQRP